MLPLQDITYETVREGDITVEVALLSLTATATRVVPAGAAIQPAATEMVRERLALALWHRTYGPLTGPLAAALASAREEGNLRILTQLEELATLLKVPTPAPQPHPPITPP